MVNDILLDSDTGELLVEAGDWKVDESTAQHERLLIDSDKGAWRQYPTAGVGIQRYLLDEAPGDLVTAIKTELRNDGMTVKDVVLNPETGEMMIDAEYDG